ncbi:discoidin domain-containing protein [Chitinophaga cymbidii]|uniref:F5/8 type C domain-containing protein n=1 Tax=Chitinophaga cymbidii TaxID=1096750 RepID=A0A512RQU1_9BACT|nr:discoidin domain-containing protein [Chitinophaga cymbidii]GEP98071.1 hypothetical protein CCY01nite_43310 [Chitinophaga cymbidii]
MRTIYIQIFCSFILLLAACRKDDSPAPLPGGSISFQLPADKDTVQIPVSILKDSAMVVGLKAALSGHTSSSDHWVSFAVDTARITAYRAEYGDAMVMPKTSWLFYKPTTRIAAGSPVSEDAELNIGLQTNLMEYSTYVLPVVIQSVDGNPDGIATSRVVYLVFKTGKPLVISKTGWTIDGVSSVFNAFAAANVLDNNNLTTYWASNITQQMPQWISINFNRDITFTAVNYYLPPLLSYPTLGGYPTSIRIETSMDGVSWTDKGVFEGNVADNMQTIDTGETTARYLRFTSLASVKYASMYDAIFISGISLVP